jgi:P pilus assembly chaperone PapD
MKSKSLILSKVKIMTINLSALAITFASLSSQAVHLSTYRIYLDDDERTKSFIVFNRNTGSQDCRLKLRHYDFDEQGNMFDYKTNELPENSAKNWVRFSPKKFTLTPANSQTIRFSMRRKAKAQSAEYRSYLVVDCGAAESPTEKKQMISIKPKLIHNVPIIVRMGELNANVKLTDFTFTKDTFNFFIERSGDRSIYGDIELVDKESGERISYQLNFSMYPETSKQSFKLSMHGHNPADLKVRFIENSKFGGEITLEKDLISE